MKGVKGVKGVKGDAGIEGERGPKAKLLRCVQQRSHVIDPALLLGLSWIERKER